MLHLNTLPLIRCLFTTPYLRSFKTPTWSGLYLLKRKYSCGVDFESAQHKVKAFEKELGIETRLKLYALYQQASVGNASCCQPSIFDFEERAKFDAWRKLYGLSKDEAKVRYAKMVSLLLADREGRCASSDGIVSNPKKVPGLRIAVENRALRITLSRPKKYNALTIEMYRGITNALTLANKSKEVSVTVIEGEGDYYCSGNDLGNLVNAKASDDIDGFASATATLFENYLKAFIEHEKPLLIFVNGPAVGIAVTTLPLADYVLASEKATFHTPFTALGMSPEGCSTYTFPILMGTLKSAEVLVFGRKLTAYEALERNLVNEIVSAESFATESQKKLDEITLLPPDALKLNKCILRDVHKQALLRANEKETILLKQRWLSEECTEAVERFLRKKH